MHVNRVRVTMDSIEYVVEADYLPEYAGDREAPPEDEGFDIGQVYWSDGVTPVALTDKQMERLEQIMLANVHAKEEYERDEIWRARYSD